MALDFVYFMLMSNLFIFFQAAFYEIMHGLWVRNGLQIRGQAMTYIQNHFCKSMVDADLFLLQVCTTQLQQSTVLKTILEQFQIMHWLSLSPRPSTGPSARARSGGGRP